MFKLQNKFSAKRYEIILPLTFFNISLDVAKLTSLCNVHPSHVYSRVRLHGNNELSKYPVIYNNNNLRWLNTFTL